MKNVLFKYKLRLQTWLGTIYLYTVFVAFWIEFIYVKKCTYIYVCKNIILFYIENDETIVIL